MLEFDICKDTFCNYSNITSLLLSEYLNYKLLYKNINNFSFLLHATFLQLRTATS